MSRGRGTKLEYQAGRDIEGLRRTYRPGQNCSRTVIHFEEKYLLLFLGRGKRSRISKVKFQKVFYFILCQYFRIN